MLHISMMKLPVLFFSTTCILTVTKIQTLTKTLTLLCYFLKKIVVLIYHKYNGVGVSSYMIDLGQASGQKKGEKGVKGGCLNPRNTPPAYVPEYDIDY